MFLTSMFAKFETVLCRDCIGRIKNAPSEGDSYSCNIAKSKYENQITLSRTSVEGERIKLKNYVCNEK